jgi:GT2 family glycosyltransferase
LTPFTDPFFGLLSGPRLVRGLGKQRTSKIGSALVADVKWSSGMRTDSLSESNALARTFVFTIDWRNRDSTQSLINSIDKLPTLLRVVVNDDLDTHYYVAGNSALKIHTLQLGKNIGFAAASNYALNKARSENMLYALHLNNDIIVPDVGLLIEFIDSFASTKFDLVSPRLVDLNGKVDFAGSAFLARLSPALYNVRAKAKHHHEKFAPTMHIDGACFLARVDSVLQIGGFDTKYFAYREEHDLSTRLINNGGSIAYYPSLTLIHIGSASSDRQPYLKQFLTTRGQLIYGKKHVRGSAKLLYYTIVSIKALIVVARSLINLDPEPISGVRDALVNVVLGKKVHVQSFNETLEFE